MTFTDEELTVIQEALQCAADDAATQAEWADEHGPDEEAEAARSRETRFYELHDRIRDHLTAGLEESFDATD